ncbi:MAG TPA: hypothetical protein DEQ80_02445 [Anaerolinea thermolimosa]|uniref:Zinc ribbon domain-containing protein n=1 Tax=Anaerolinea thermolimosa TaxID=229919 RepID=A0A3D1JG08_9CHLR|nr:hypothetical protein [Anaerolinea thermolimosa]GAP07573.1 hypothetical protein ATHL_02458 [Anaerolinea thermolimosa]HCE16698.1 hypothetical protein [Anaerolinea thermolimosa]
MSEKGLLGLTCPRCGGTVPVPEGQALVICPFCEMRSVVSGERGVRRYQVPLRVKREQALESLRQFLTRGVAIARDTLRRAEISEAFLVHIPFWAAWGQGVAWAFGQERVGSGENKRYVPREKRALSEVSWNEVACDVGEFGVRRISLEGRPLEPFNSDQLHYSGMVFEPVGSPERALESARKSFEEWVASRVKLSRTSQLFTRILGARLGLVYYPVWVLRYLYRGRAFQVVIDGFDGQVLYGKAPGNVLYRAAMLVGGMAVGAFVAVDVPALIVSLSDDSDILGIALISLAAGIGLMVAGWQKFRYGEQVEYHRYKANQESASGLGGDLLDVKDIVREVQRFIE